MTLYNAQIGNTLRLEHRLSASLVRQSERSIGGETFRFYQDNDMTIAISQESLAVQLHSAHREMYTVMKKYVTLARKSVDGDCFSDIFPIAAAAALGAVVGAAANEAFNITPVPTGLNFYFNGHYIQGAAGVEPFGIALGLLTGIFIGLTPREVAERRMEKAADELEVFTKRNDLSVGEEAKDFLMKYTRVAKRI